MVFIDSLFMNSSESSLYVRTGTSKSFSSDSGSKKAILQKLFEMSILLSDISVETISYSISMYFLLFKDSGIVSSAFYSYKIGFEKPPLGLRRAKPRWGLGVRWSQKSPIGLP
jgi:hypothetical protein